MSKLVEAIDAEVRGDFEAAAAAYEGLTEEGSALDRIGVYQALARCHEKRGQLPAAAPWRRKAAQGYMALSDEDMPKDERRYYALLEARNAVQDLAASPEMLAEAGKEYGEILAENWKGGPEGLTHEGLFGALFLRRQEDWPVSARYFFDVSEALNEQATETGDERLRHIALRTYELAEETAMKAGRPDVARVANLRAIALRGGPKPQPIGGL